jgi:hypothetical protein
MFFKISVPVLSAKRFLITLVCWGNNNKKKNNKENELEYLRPNLADRFQKG